jgi:riboflavin synthase
VFTGIVEELGEITGVEDVGEASTAGAGGIPERSARFRVRGPAVTAGARYGDSIAVNGVCLTVVDLAGDEFTADVMAETLRRSDLGTLRPGSRVNLERPTAVGGRLGGHIVQGHVDGVGTLLERSRCESGDVVRIALPARLARYVVEKGSITVDGISLTVVDAGPDHFTVSLIPATLALTTLGIKEPGEQVNLEVDVIAKYVERLLTTASPDDAGPAAPAPATTPDRPRQTAEVAK